ncbi:MAG: PilT/PilU family type 4a pilus ATPase [Methylotenera sp.]|nr:PilT/PilU family type 4a pilus ATPase [Oligoflexia bacterium]
MQLGVSDVHLHPGTPPGFRMKGDMINVKMPPLTDEDMIRICGYMVKDQEVLQNLPKLKDYDGSFEVKGLSRFRFNIFRNRGKIGAILRLIPAIIPTIDQLKLPGVLRTIADMHRGLVLVTGATGSGKSSTLAAMIDHINTNHKMHILTIEDPVEFVHQQKMSRVTQREVGTDTNSFAGALRSALRQDPDVILVGEMRDAETIDIALKAAETGHMVFSTVHTTDAIKTIGRLISVFPPEEQRMVRMRLADNLTATVSQRLIARAEGTGMVAAQEIMIANGGIRECISDPALTGQINDFISKSRELVGGQTFEQHLVELYQAGHISLVAAKEAASNAADFERNLIYGSGKKSADRGAPNPDDDIQLDHLADSEAASEDDAA